MEYFSSPISSFTSHRSRIKGEKLDRIKCDILPKYEIFGYEFVKSCEELELEIGSGFGQTVSHLAKSNPQKTFVACEVFIDAVASICSKLEEDSIQNVRIYKDDARFFLKQIPNQRIANIYLLFPDPWPKKKHNKRRILTQEFLQEIARVLKRNGKLWIATDDDSYKEWMIAVFELQNYLKWTNQNNYSTEPQWWVKTKFQIKAEEAGRSSAFFVLEKIKINES